MNMPWLVVVAVVLAGCSTAAPESDHDPNPVTPEPEPTEEPAVEELGELIMSVFDCEGQVIYVPVDWEAVAAALPDDLEPISFGSTMGALDDQATATAYSLIYHCQTTSGLAGNATDVGIGMWGFAARSDVHFPDETGYTWQSFVVDDATVSDSLAEAGFPVVLGEAGYAVDDGTPATRATSTMSGGGTSVSFETWNLEAATTWDAWTVRFLFVEDREILGGADVNVESLMGASSYGTLTGSVPGLAGPAAGVGAQAAWDGLSQTFTWFEVDA